MKLSSSTTDILKMFSAINSNMVIQPGKKFSTMSAAKDMMAEYEGEDEFTKAVSIFNLNELLGVVGAFKSPELTLEDNFMIITEGKQKVKYIYADAALLTTPSKEIKMPVADVTFDLTADQLLRVQKMSGILGVDDLSFIGNKKTVIARLHDTKNPSGNSFDIELDVPAVDNFNIRFKVERMMKLYSGDYKVEISSKKISRFTHSAIKLKVFIAVESDSSFD